MLSVRQLLPYTAASAVAAVAVVAQALSEYHQFYPAMVAISHSSLSLAVSFINNDDQQPVLLYHIILLVFSGVFFLFFFQSSLGWLTKPKHLQIKNFMKDKLGLKNSRILIYHFHFFFPDVMPGIFLFLMYIM